ncbi:MAG: hypothetical protein FD153_1000, partial [Rhodospirillaceae bacterium]
MRQIYAMKWAILETPREGFNGYSRGNALNALPLDEGGHSHRGRESPTGKKGSVGRKWGDKASVWALQQALRQGGRASGLLALLASVARPQGWRDWSESSASFSASTLLPNHLFR